MKKETPALTKPLASGASDKPRTDNQSPEPERAGMPKDDLPKVADSPTTKGSGQPDHTVLDGGASSSPESIDKADAEVSQALSDGEQGEAKSADAPLDTTSPPPPPPTPSRMPIVIAIVALLGAAASGWQVYEQRTITKELRAELAERLTGADVAVGEVRALSRQNQEVVSGMQGKIGALDAKVAETEGQAAALEALYQEYSRSRGDQALAEVGRAISIASQQLQLAGNFEAALIALQDADDLLAMPEQGHLQGLRKALLKDIDAVRTHPRVDVSGLALRLEILIEKIDDLPLAYEFSLPEEAAVVKEPAEHVTPAPESGVVDQASGYVRNIAADVWNEVRTMVRLERMDLADPALLAPEQSTYLREGIKIRLLTARLALLARDGQTYDSDLAQARSLIERFFDTREDVVTGVLGEIGELEKLSVNSAPPSLDDSFAALKVAQARSGGGRILPAIGVDAPAAN